MFICLLPFPSPALLPYIRPLSRISPHSLAVLPKYTEPAAGMKDGCIPLCQLYLMYRSHPALNTESCFSAQKHWEQELSL